jgi:hypothetical protein
MYSVDRSGPWTLDLCGLKLQLTVLVHLSRPAFHNPLVAVPVKFCILKVL